ncbi:MAG: DUF4870 domain-containing protein [Desulfurococcales archaeon]|nr:DUF4870 domain-containing protein [Desulfurococcales archaeon]
MSTSEPGSEAPQPTQPATQIDDTKLWQLIAWLLGIIGAIIAYVAGPKDDPKVKHWIRMSIAFFIVGIIAYVVTFIVAFIPLLGFLISVVIWLGLLIIWILGILKILQGELWEPPVISSIAAMISL